MEESAFEQIAVRLRRKAVDVSRTYGLDTAAAEDIAQDVMLKLWSMRDELDGYSSPEGLVARIAGRLALNSMRRRHTVAIGTDEQRMVSLSAGPEEHLEEHEGEEWLTRKIEALPSTQHTILYMRQVERRTHGEIAALLGIKETSVSTLLARARKTLFDEMKRRGNL